MSLGRCKSCGAELSGKYCSVCGEKLLTKEDKLVKSWLRDVFSDLTNIDGKVLLTIKELFFFPARYALNFSQGIRVKYIKPLNLFLIANILYFLLSGASTFKTSLQIQMSGLPYSTWIADLVEKKLDKEDKNIEEYAAQYNEKSNEISKLIIIMLVPVLGSVLFLCFKRNGLLLSEGFNLAYQFWAFFTFFFLLFIPALAWFLYNYTNILIFGAGENDIAYSIIILILSGIYIGFMMPAWKPQKWFIYVLRIILVIASFFPMIVVYRLLLFGLTFWLV